MSFSRSAIMLATGVLTAGCGSATGLDANALEGTWQATEIVFINNADTTQTANIVTLDGASFTMTVEASGTVATVFDDGVGGTSSDSGTFMSDGSSLTLGGDVFNASRSGDRMTLVDATEFYDFDGDGSDEPATLTIELQRQ